MVILHLRPMHLANLVTILIIVLCASLITACGSGDDDDTATPTEDVSQILNDAADRWDATETAHFELEIDGETYLDDAETIQLKGASGDMQRPDSVKAEASISASLLNVDVSLIFIGDEAYMTDLVTGSWIQAPDDFSYDPGILLSDDEGLSNVLRSLENAELVGAEEVDGKSANHVTATVPGNVVERLTAGTIGGDQVNVDVWIDTETADILRVRVAEPTDDQEDRIWTITLSNFGEPVEISRPPV